MKEITQTAIEWVFIGSGYILAWTAIILAVFTMLCVSAILLGAIVGMLKEVIHIIKTGRPS